MVDQLRMPRWFGPGGHAAALPPNMARLARSGVSFLRHYTASNDCSPARSAMLTGLHTHQTGCMITGASTLDPGFPTWGTMLREQGYATYWYGKWHLTHGDRQWNEFDGPRALARYGFKGGTFPSPNGAPGQGWHVDPKIAAQFDQWYSDAAGDGPWCTTVSFVNPHDIAWWWRWSRISATEASAPSAIAKLPPNFETPEQLAARRQAAVQLSLQETSAVSFGEVPFSGPNLEATWLPFLDLYAKLQLQVDRQVGARARDARKPPPRGREHDRRLHLRSRRVRRLARPARQGRRRLRRGHPRAARHQGLHRQLQPRAGRAQPDHLERRHRTAAAEHRERIRQLARGPALRAPRRRAPDLARDRRAIRRPPGASGRCTPPTRS